MELGLCVLPSNLRDAVAIAAAADAAGVDRLGMCDSPYLYVDPHIAMARALEETAALRVGPFVTNPTTRHWSVQAAAFRALREIGGDRVYFGIGPGDSAVHSVGLPPARIGAIRDYVERLREHGPEGLPAMVAAGGPKGVAAAARYADDVVLGQGVEPEAIVRLRDTALAAASAAGRDVPPRLWLFAILHLAEHEDQLEQVRRDVRSPVMSYSRQALDHSFAGKDVPAELQAGLRTLYREFSFEDYSRSGASHNARLLDSETGRALERFLFDRFAIVDTPERAADRLAGIAAATGVTGIFASVVSSDPIGLIRLLGERLVPRLGAQGSCNRLR